MGAFWGSAFIISATALCIIATYSFCAARGIPTISRKEVFALLFFALAVVLMFTGVTTLRNTALGYPATGIKFATPNERTVYSVVWYQEKNNDGRMRIILKEEESGYERYFSIRPDRFSTTNFPKRFVLVSKGNQFMVRKIEDLFSPKLPPKN